MFDEIKAVAARLRRRLRRLVLTSGRCTTSGAVDAAVDAAARAGPRLRRRRRGLAAHHRLRRRQGPGAASSRDGEPTYFAADCAYYLDKRARGFDRVHLHARRRPPRLHRPAAGDRGRASATTRTQTVEMLIGQLVNLVRDGEPVRMSKRAGTVVTLDDLVDAVGVDAARYALVRYSVDSPLDLDLDLLDPADQRQPGLLRAVRARPAGLARPQRRRPRHRPAADDEFDPALLDARAGGRPAAGARRVPAGRRDRRRAARAAPGRPLPGGAGRRLPPVLRRLPGAAAAATRTDRPDLHARPAVAVRRDPAGARQRPRPARRLRAGADVTCGARGRRPARRRCTPSRRRRCWPRRPTPNALAAAGLAARRAPATTPARSSVGGVDVRDLAPSLRHPAVRPRRGRLPRPLPGLRATAFGGADVYYAAKAFLCQRGRCAGWPRRGSALDVCTGGELAVGAARRLPGRADRACTATTSPSPSWRRRSSAGVGRIVVDSFDEIARLAAIAAERGVRRRGAGPGHRRRRGAHPRVHRHRARGPEVRLLAGRRRGGRGGAAGSSPLPSLELVGLHSPHRLADLRHRRLRGRRPPGGRRCWPRSATSTASSCAELDLGGGLGIAYTAERRPARRRASWPRGCAAIVDRECARAGLAVPRLSVEPGRAIVGPGTVTLYEVGTVKDVELDGGRPTLRQRRRRDERQHPHRAVRRRVHRARWRPARQRRAADAVPGWSASTARAATSWCKDAWLPADLAPGDLLAVAATGAYCRSMASNYNHVPRPPVVAVARTARPGCSCGGRPRRTCSRSTPAEPGQVRSAWQDGATAGTTVARARRPRGRGPRAEPWRRSMGAQPLRVALLGCGTVGREVVRLLHEQADDLAARVGAPLELVGIAVRRPARHPDVPAGAAHHRRRRRWSSATTSTSSSR